jgi:hypothetical protein
MKKILAWIKKNWKTIVEVVGGAIIAIFAVEALTNKGGQPLVPNIDVKAQDAKIDMNTAQEVASINQTAIQTVASVNAETVTEAIQTLSVPSQTAIQGVIDDAAKNAADAVIKDLK